MRFSKFERVEKYLESLLQVPDSQVQKRALRVRVFLWFLKQLSRIYRSIIQLRLFLYAHGIIRHHTLGCQVISVGNLTVGGTGKTPVVEVFARELQKEGRKVAILSRGYKKKELSFSRKVKNFLSGVPVGAPRIVSDGKELLLDSDMSGDEPYMLASNLPNVVVLVDKDRVKSGRYAINRLGCDTLILDDGFQYLSLKHRVDIVLVDCTNPFGNENVLPRGILREPVKNIRRADFIFITKSDGKNSLVLREELRRMNPRAEIVECKHCARHLRNVFSGGQKGLEELAGLRVIAVSGIAVPSGFENELERHGAVVIDRRRFADHHRYSQQEIIDIINHAVRLGADCIVTTEKDAVRFPRLDRFDVPVYFLRVDIDILSGVEDFQGCISRICFKEAS